MAQSNLADNCFQSDRPDKLYIQVEDDHLYVASDCCGCGDELSDPDTLRRLHAELGQLLERLDAQR